MATNTEQRLKTDRRTELRKFGYSFGAGMAILTAVGLWKHFWAPIIITTTILSLFHLGAAVFRVKLLPPSFKVVTTIGKFLGQVITVVVFTLVYYLIFTPIALVLRLCHKDVIGNISENPAWIAVPEKDNDPQRIAKLF
jgi:hypothetical protein